VLNNAIIHLVNIFKKRHVKILTTLQISNNTKLHVNKTGYKIALNRLISVRNVISLNAGAEQRKTPRGKEVT